MDAVMCTENITKRRIMMTLLELLSELEATLELMDDNFLSPGLRTAKRNVLKNMKRIKSTSKSAQIHLKSSL